MTKKQDSVQNKKAATLTISLAEARLVGALAEKAEAQATKAERDALKKLKKLIAEFGPVPIDPG